MSNVSKKKKKVHSEILFFCVSGHFHYRLRLGNYLHLQYYHNLARPNFRMAQAFNFSHTTLNKTPNHSPALQVAVIDLKSVCSNTEGKRELQLQRTDLLMEKVRTISCKGYSKVLQQLDEQTFKVMEKKPEMLVGNIYIQCKGNSKSNIICNIGVK